MSGTAHNLEKEIRGYIIVGTGLLTLTIVTVTVSYLHLNLVKAIILALFIATIKGSMVACYFMHLISERKLIYFVLTLTVSFFAAMMLLIVLGHYGHLVGTEMTGSKGRPAAAHHAAGAHH